MDELTVFLIVLGCYFFANIISLIIATQTYDEFKSNKSFWSKVGYGLYFLFFGVFYWFKVGCGALIEWIKFKIKKG